MYYGGMRKYSDAIRTRERRSSAAVSHLRSISAAIAAMTDAKKKIGDAF
jgi:hypothetical protein